MRKIAGQEELELIERLNTAAGEKRTGLRGLGGWLIFFQFRIYLGVLLSLYLLITYRHNIYAIITFIVLLAPVIVCLIFFYRRKIVFRTIYTVMAAIGLVYASQISFQYLLGSAAAEGIICFGLFSSNRVKNTFS